MNARRRRLPDARGSRSGWSRAGPSRGSLGRGLPGHGRAWPSYRSRRAAGGPAATRIRQYGQDPEGCYTLVVTAWRELGLISRVDYPEVRKLGPTQARPPTPRESFKQPRTGRQEGQPCLNDASSSPTRLTFEDSPVALLRPALTPDSRLGRWILRKAIIRTPKLPLESPFGVQVIPSALECARGRPS
jgi:hypothetical protein